MIRVALLNGTNRNNDHDISKIIETFIDGGVITGLNIDSGSIQPGYAFVPVTRAGGVAFNVLVHITEEVTVDTTGTKKVWIEIDQTAIDDGSSNNADGTNIATIETGADYPSTNFVKIASITGDVVTDDREIPELKTSIIQSTIDWITNNYATTAQVDAAIAQASTVSNLTESIYPLGEPVEKGDSLYLSQPIGYADISTLDQPIGKNTDTTKVAVKVTGSGVSASTFKLALKKITSPSVNLNFRIETDNNNTPSGTLADANATASIAPGDLTTSYADTTVTLAGAITLDAGHTYWIVMYVGTYGSETLNDTNYYSVGYKNATSHPYAMFYDGAAWQYTAPAGADETMRSDGTGVIDSFEPSSSTIIITPNQNVLLTTLTFDNSASWTNCVLTGGGKNRSFGAGSAPLTLNESLVSGVTYTLTFTGGSYYWHTSGSNTMTGTIATVSGSLLNADVDYTLNFTPIGAPKYGAVYVGGDIFNNKVLKKTSASSTDTLPTDILRFAVVDGEGGDTIPVAFDGEVDGFTSLTGGELYYLSNTNGAISTVPGTHKYSVGYAISQSTLLILSKNSVISLNVSLYVSRATSGTGYSAVQYCPQLCTGLLQLTHGGNSAQTSGLEISKNNVDWTQIVGISGANAKLSRCVIIEGGYYCRVRIYSGNSTAISGSFIIS